MNKPALLILAAGMGSRYGGLKQIDPLGPNGEIIIDYSIYDAIQAGFGKIVFVIKKELLSTFQQVVGNRVAKQIDVDYAFQDLDDLPEGFTPCEGRVKPWGTGHAVYAARRQLSGPFGIIGSDDFFGRDTLLQLGSFCADGCDGRHLAMVGFRIGNTLSESGGVSRGICQEHDGFLTAVTERTGICRGGDGQITFDDNGRAVPLPDNAPVSMNVWGFHSDLFPVLERDFSRWLAAGDGDPMKREYYLPAFVDRQIRVDAVSVRLLDTHSKWYGVTYQADKPSVMQALSQMHQSSLYPALR